MTCTVYTLSWWHVLCTLPGFATYMTCQRHLQSTDNHMNSIGKSALPSLQLTCNCSRISTLIDYQAVLEADCPRDYSLSIC